MRRVGRQHLVALLAAILVECPGQQEPGELAVRPRRGLEGDVRQPGELGERPLEPPHQLERALRALRVLRGMQPRVSRERRDPLVEAGVVLHRAGAERVRPGVEIEVPPRDPVVVAHDLRLGHLWQLGRAVAQEIGGNELVERALGYVARR